MNAYRTIKELVIETCQSEGHFPSYEKLTALVRQHFPTSKWQRTHYAWYKSQIKHGGIIVRAISEAPLEDNVNEDVIAIDESLDTSVSLERDLHLYFATRISTIEAGLTLVEDGVAYQTPDGEVDPVSQGPKRLLSGNRTEGRKSER